MSKTSTFYIVTVAGGKCLENTQGQHGVLDCVPKESESQKWVLETNGEDPNIVAIKSCTDGKYLINAQPYAINKATIAMSDDKQLWTLEKGRFPRSCFIRSNACTAGASYLNDYNGEYADNHYVHMWQMDKERDWWLTWYLVDTETSAAFNPIQTQISEGASGEDLIAREKAVAEKEQNVAEKTKDIEQRETTLKGRESKVADQEAQEKTSAEKAKELEQREAALKRRENKVADQEAREKTSTEKAKELEQREAALKRRENKVADQEAALKKQAAAAKPQNMTGGGTIDPAKASKPSGGSSATANGTGVRDDGVTARDLDLLKAENDNLRLQLRVQDLQNQLDKARQPSQPSVPTNTAASKPMPISQNFKANIPAGGVSTKPTTSGPSLHGTTSKQINGATKSPSTANSLKPSAKRSGDHAVKLRDAAEEEGAVVFTCGHVAYPPPRKLEKTIVGILYEGLDQPPAFSARQQAALTRIHKSCN